MRGIGNVEYVRQGSEVAVVDQPFWSFIYEASTTKHAKYNIGDRVVTPDGRVFRYAKAAATCQSQGGAYNSLKTIDVAVAPAQGTGCGAVGNTAVTITKATTAGIAGDGVIAKDELKGGYIVIGNGSGQSPQMRGIIGNAASVAGAASMNVFLDGALVTVVTVGTTTIETYPNPYSYMTGGLTTSSDYVTFLGVPAIAATVGQYFWLQTWGVCWLTSNSVTCDSARDRTIVFVGNGSVESSNDETVESGIQIAGVAFDTSGSGSSNAPMVMLQISI